MRCDSTQTNSRLEIILPVNVMVSSNSSASNMPPSGTDKLGLSFNHQPRLGHALSVPNQVQTGVVRCILRIGATSDDHGDELPRFASVAGGDAIGR